MSGGLRASYIGGSGALRGHRTFEKAFLGGPISWTTTDEKVLYSDKSRNCGKGTGKGKGKGQGKGVDALLEGTLKILLHGSFLLVSGPGRPGKLPTSRTATREAPHKQNCDLGPPPAAAVCVCFRSGRPGSGLAAAWGGGDGGRNQGAPPAFPRPPRQLGSWCALPPNIPHASGSGRERRRLSE